MAAAASAQAAVVVRVSVPGDAARQRLDRLGLDLAERVSRRSVDAVLYTPADRELLRRTGLRYRTLVNDVGAEDLALAREQATAADAARSSLPSGRTFYRHYGDYREDMDALVAGYRGLVRPVTVGHSVDGRAIEGVEVAADVGATDDGRPAFVLVGLHHAREWPSGDNTMEFGIDLAQSYGHDARVTALLQKVRVFVIPVANPDGFISSREAIDNLVTDNLDQVPHGNLLRAEILTNAISVANSGSLRRKNCDVSPRREADPAQAPAPCDARLGVDLNRNYGAYWGGPGGGTVPAQQDYRGAAPFSEPETEAFRRFFSSHQISLLISNHTYGRDILRPPGFTSQGEETPDEAALLDLSERMGNVTGATPDDHYYSEPSYLLYEVTGATEDWTYFAEGVLGYTFEIGPHTFHPSFNRGVLEEYAPASGRGLREAWLVGAEAAADPATHALIEGRANAGRTLRISKSFQQTTSPIELVAASPFNFSSFTPKLPAQLLDERLDSTMTVPPSGSFTWHVNPSTRPLVARGGGHEQWTLTCEDGSGGVLATVPVEVARGGVADVGTLSC